MKSHGLYLLDTNAVDSILNDFQFKLAHRLKGEPRDSVFISVVTEAELLFGLARRPESAALRRKLTNFFTYIRVLPWDSKIAHVYAALRAEQEKIGKPLGPLDMMIAAHALALGVVLVTNDKAFLQVKGLKVEDWMKA